MAYLVERMRRIEYRNLVIRLWIDTENSDVADTVANRVLLELQPGSCADKPTAATILEMNQKINAIEILLEDGNGIVLYRDWP